MLRARALTKRFGGLTAVADLDLEVHAGEILGVIGPNGAGKSTTFNMIAGATAPTAGSIDFDGAPIAGRPPHEIAARGIMRTFQHNQPFAGLSLAENVMVGMHTRFSAPLWKLIAGSRAAQRAERDARARAEALLDFVGLAEQRADDVGTLSFGQGRLLEIARGLAGEPRLMLFDEPAAGLTPAECERVAAIIRDIAARGIAVLLIEHDMRFLMALAERVAVLNFGRKIAEGAPAAVRADPAVLAAYLGSPAGDAHA
ncbi:MAG: ABC transporter ATP-binding protein [Burkholderiales bacterium]|nr:ABC transporter ATP-binding protein [Burkholderiales bacterium]